MIYRMFTYPPERQLQVLDQLAAIGFKVMYEVVSTQSNLPCA